MTPESASDVGDSELSVTMAGVPESWSPISNDKEADNREARAALVRFLSDLLQSPDLAVLAGLGTSLCIQGAPTMGDLWTNATRLPDFEEVCAEVGVPAGEAGDVELLLSRCEMFAAIKPEAKCSAFKVAAEHLILDRCCFVSMATSVPIHQDFLRRVARRSTRLHRTQLFTTNYDLAFEVAAASLGYLLIDGFSYTAPRTFDAAYFDYDFVRRGVGASTPEFVPEVFALHKLHGSVNWDSASGRITQVGKPNRPVLIFPRQSKYELSYELPFLESMGRFQACLRQSNVGVLIIGFGLRDKHLVEPVMGCLRANPTARIAIVDIAARTSASDAFVTIRRLAERGDSRLAVVNGSFEALTSLLPDLAQRSEAERQEQLVRELLSERSGPPSDDLDG